MNNNNSNDSFTCEKLETNIAFAKGKNVWYFLLVKTTVLYTFVEMWLIIHNFDIITTTPIKLECFIF